jgi:transcriptional regulator with XRE-family HTH domain
MPRSLLPHPNYAERIREARERIGLSLDQLAARMGQSPSSQWDLEADPNEVLMCISLGWLAGLCEVLQLRPRDLLSDGPVPAGATLALPELMARIRAYIGSHEMGLEAFEELAGWEVGMALDDPEHARDWNPDGLWDICQLIGVEWLLALPEC